MTQVNIKLLSTKSQNIYQDGCAAGSVAYLPRPWISFVTSQIACLKIELEISKFEMEHLGIWNLIQPKAVSPFTRVRSLPQGKKPKTNKQPKKSPKVMEYHCCKLFYHLWPPCPCALLYSTLNYMWVFVTNMYWYQLVQYCQTLQFVHLAWSRQWKT